MTSEGKHQPAYESRYVLKSLTSHGMFLLKCTFSHENIPANPLASSTCFMLLTTELSHDYILTGIRRCDAKSEFTDTMNGHCILDYKCKLNGLE